MVWVRVWGVHVRLTTMGTRCPHVCHANVNGVRFCERWWVSFMLMSIQYFHSPI
jgi:hypothetical protein